MTLLWPAWLLLAIPLAVSMWLWRMPSRLLTVMRLIVLALLLLGMAGLAVNLPSRAGAVIVIADRSRSMPDGYADAQREAVRLIQDQMTGADTLAVVSFAETAAVEHPPQLGAFGGFTAEVGADASNLNEAVETTLALIGPDTPGRLVVLSDGRWTGNDPAAAAARAASRGVAIDFRLLERPIAGDLAVDAIDAPGSVQPREAFLISAWVRSPVAQEIEYELRRGDVRLAAGRRAVPAGLSRLLFRDALDEPGTAQYLLTVRRADAEGAASPGAPGPAGAALQAAEADPVPENNRARLLLGVEGPRPILLVSDSPENGLGQLLRAGGLDVRTRTPPQVRWTLEDLSGYAAVMIEEVPANDIGGPGMETLAEWVRRTGAGLMLTGGQTAYGPGGYFRSPLDPILPVSMELRREHRKHRLAIAIAMDRSGSMAAPVSGGRTKMGLANIAAAQVVDLLTGMDEVAVIAVDSTAHPIVPLERLDDKEAVRGRILGIDSMGGGIFVYEALQAAAAELTQTDAGARHIILFADAADSEQPGQYRELLARCREAGITCSVIGLGTEQDVDAGFLRDIAQRGEGRIFFTQDATQLPRLFAQDTFVVARSSFVDETTPIRLTGGLTSLANRSFDPPPPPVGGYNLTYLRDGANLAALTADEYNAPLIAAWQVGAGRVLCYTAQADGRFTGPIARWPQVGHFLTALARWTAGDPAQLPDHMVLTQDVREGIAHITLHLDPERDAPGQDFRGQAPSATVLRGLPGRRPETLQTRLRWTSPDTLGVDVPLTGTETVLATVDVPGVGPVSLPPATLPYSPEFRPVSEDRGAPALRRMAAITAGAERINLGDVWADLPRRPRLIDLSPWLLGAAILVLLLEVLERRTGLLSTGRFRLRRDAEAAAASRRGRPWAVKLWRPKRAQPAAPAAEPAAGGGAAASAPAAASQPRHPAAGAKPTPGPRKASAPAPDAKETEGVLDALGQARRRAHQRTKRRP